MEGDQTRQEQTGQNPAGQTQTGQELMAELEELRAEVVQLRQRLEAGAIAEETLRQREEQGRLALEGAQIGTWYWNLLTNEVFWSKEHEELFGLAPGTFDGTYATFEACIYPPDREPLRQIIDRTIRERTDYQHEFRVVWADGSIHWIGGKGRPSYDERGQAVRMTGIVVDISDRKRIEAEQTQTKTALQQQVEWQRLVMEITQRIRQSLNLKEILNTAVAEVRQFLHINRVIIFQFDPETWNGTVVVESVAAEWMPLLSRQIYDPCFAESYIQPFRQGLITAKEDIYTAGIGSCHLNLLSGFQVRANLVVPILQGEDLWGLLIAHHCATPRKWQPLEIDLLQQLAAQVGIAIQQSILFEQGQLELIERRRTEEDLRRLKQDLEIRVQERTQELERSQAYLRQQVEREQLIGGITQRIRQSLNLNEILATAVAEVRQILNADRALIFQLTADSTGIVVQESVVPSYPAIVNMVFPEECFPAECYAHYCQGLPRIVLDAASDEWSNCLVEFMQQVDVKTKIAAPIVHHREDSTTILWGLLIVHACVHDRQWQPIEANSLQQIADQLAIAIQQAELYQQLREELRERKRAEEALRQSEARFRSLSEFSPLGIFRADVEGKCIYTNPRCQAICGFTFEQSLGDGWRQFIHPDDLEDFAAQWANSATANQEFLIDVRNIHRDGSVRFCQIRVAPVLSALDELTGYVGTVEDITEKRAVEQMKNEFISIVSHELRTPLTSIRGSLGLLAAGVFDDSPDEMRHMIAIAATDTERLVRLVNDILDLERLGAGKVALAREACDVGYLMRRSVEVMQASAQEVGITLSVTPLSAYVWADGDRIIQTLTNLLSNAIKFSPAESTIWLSAEVSTQDPSSPLPTGYVLFSVKDYGRGIPPDKLESIFGRFQQVDSSDARMKGGTGLGLAICQTIVLQHGGLIWAESVMGEGSTFYFTLPIAAE